MSAEERKTLVLKAAKLIKSAGISCPEREDNYDVLRKIRGYVGHADYYLHNCWGESQLEDNADVTIYKQLLEVDTRLGTTQSEQLFQFLKYSVRMDLIKV